MDNASTDELDRVCGNCNYSFPAEEGGGADAICLKDAEFEPYMDRLLDEGDFSCCAALIKRKRFPLDREACADFDPIDFVDGEEFSPELARDIESMSAKGTLTPENLSMALAMESFRTTDWSRAPVDDCIERLKAAAVHARKEALSGIGFLVSQGNRAAFNALCDYLRDLSPAQTPDDCHFRSEVLRHLSCRKEFQRETAHLLVEDLLRTHSNNHTRPWFTDVWRFFERCETEVAQEALQPILDSKRFSYRIKKRVKSIIDFGDRYAMF